MPDVKPFGMARIREAVAERVAASSLRAVATEIGMSWSGLRKFLRGGSPHRATAQKLLAWYHESRKQASAKRLPADRAERADVDRSEEPTSELQSRVELSYDG